MCSRGRMPGNDSCYHLLCIHGVKQVFMLDPYSKVVDPKAGASYPFLARSHLTSNILLTLLVLKREMRRREKKEGKPKTPNLPQKPGGVYTIPN